MMSRASSVPSASRFTTNRRYSQASLRKRHVLVGIPGSRSKADSGVVFVTELISPTSLFVPEKTGDGALSGEADPSHILVTAVCPLQI